MDQNKTKLLDALKRNPSIEEVVAVGYELLGNPFIVNDTSYRLYTRTENLVTDDSLWNEIARLGTFSPETVDFFRDELFISAVAYSDCVALLKSREIKYDRMNGKVFSSDHVHIGNICLVACYRPFVPEDYVLLEKLCEIIAPEFEEHERFFAKQLERECALAQLLDGSLQPDTPEFDLISAIEAELKPNLYLALVDISGYDPTLIHLRYFRDTLRNIQSEYQYYTYGTHVLILINTDLEQGVLPEMGPLHRFFEESNLFVGVSSRFSGLHHARKYFLQAQSAFRHGMRMYPGLHLFLYDDYKVDSLLEAAKSRRDDEPLTDPIIEAISAHDHAKGTACLDLLYRYMLHGLDSAVAAAELGLSPEAFKAELLALSQQFHIDWNNGNRLAGMFLALKRKLEVL